MRKMLNILLPFPFLGENLVIRPKLLAARLAGKLWFPAGQHCVQDEEEKGFGGDKIIPYVFLISFS